MTNVNSIFLTTLTTVFLLVLVACSGGDSEAKRILENTEPSTNNELDIRFDSAVANFVKTTWNTWASGEGMGQCLIANSELMDRESKEAVIEHGIEKAFEKLTGESLSSLGRVWDLCESQVASAPAPSTNSLPARGGTVISTAPKTKAPVLNFETSTSAADFPDAVQEKFRAAVDAQFDPLTEKAGISVAVYQDGQLWRYAQGESSASTEMAVGTPNLVRSTSKTFLGALVLQQVDQGLYALTDTLGFVLSGNAEYESFDKSVINPDVTIEQLLTMTSGIRNIDDYSRKEYTELQASPNWEPAGIVRLVTTDFEEPGRFEYSNTNSMLLGLIAEHKGELPLAHLYKSQLLDPIGVIAILLPQDQAPPNTARPYSDLTRWGGVGFGDITESSHHNNWYQATGNTTWAAAGIISTPENMARWAYELFRDKGKVLSSTASASLLASFSGPPISMAGSPQQYGYHSTQKTILLNGRQVTGYGHPGAGGGFTSDLYYVPELDMAISLIANSSSDARSREEAQGKLVHRTLDEIAEKIFQAIAEEQ